MSDTNKEESMENRILGSFIACVKEKGLGVHGAVVRQHGQIVDRHDFIEPQGRVQLFSASKSWTAIAAGIAMDEGRFSIGDRMIDLLKGEIPWELPENYDRLTVRHLLTMSTGHAECPVFRRQEQERRRMIEAGEDPRQARGFSGVWYEAFMTTPLDHDPDEAYWTYNNGTTYILSRIVEKTSGMPMRDYLVPRVFAPLGIEDPQWDTDPEGHSLGAIGLHLTTEELSRGGQLLLNKGRWGDRQLVSEAFVNEMTKKQVDNTRPEADENGCAGYGYQTWMCARPGCYRMDGMFSQLSIGIPDCDAVVALTSHEEKNGPMIIKTVFSEIVPELEKRLG